MDPKAKKQRALKELETVAAELIYISETDAGFNVVDLDSTAALNAANIGKLLKSKKIDPIEEASAAELFERLTRQRDWHGAAERTRTKQYADLLKVLEKHLVDLKVFRIGRVNIDIYVLGRAADGTIAGVKTSATET